MVGSWTKDDVDLLRKKYFRNHKCHQPSGLRWFRFKTLLIFQLGGFTLPPTPFPGVWIQGAAEWNRIHFRCSFRAPFFSPLGTPQIVITSYSGSKTASFWGPKQSPKQAPISGLTFSLLFVDFVSFSIPPQVPPV